MCSKHSAPRVVACDEHTKKMKVAQAVNPRTDAASKVLIILRHYSTLEISPLITIFTADRFQLNMVTCDRLTRLVRRSGALVNCAYCCGLKIE
jgi:hypothetical protein